MTTNAIPPVPTLDVSLETDVKNARAIEETLVKFHLPNLTGAPEFANESFGTGLKLSKFLKFERVDVLTRSFEGKKNVLICEGDSWFNHPVIRGDVPEELQRFKYPVLHSNRPGKRLSQSASEKTYLAPFKDHRKSQIAALLLSGGGNDLIAWNRFDSSFSPVFKPATTKDPKDYIDPKVLEGFLLSMSQHLRTIHADLKSVNAKIPVFIHCYDVIQPSNYPAPLLKGEWINGQLDAVGVPKDKKFRLELAHYFMELWQDSYIETCKQLGFHFVDVRGTVQGRWYDEIHPTYGGFHEVTAKFWEALHRAGVKP